MMSEFKKQRAKHLCDVMKELSGIDPMDTSREQDVVTARMMVAVVLRNDGFTTKEIGTLLGRADHSRSRQKQTCSRFRYPYGCNPHS